MADPMLLIHTPSVFSYINIQNNLFYRIIMIAPYESMFLKDNSVSLKSIKYICTYYKKYFENTF